MKNKKSIIPDDYSIELDNENLDNEDPFFSGDHEEDEYQDDDLTLDDVEDYLNSVNKPESSFNFKR